jgi:hypothetical protein
MSLPAKSGTPIAKPAPDNIDIIHDGVSSIVSIESQRLVLVEEVRPHAAVLPCTDMISL